jgi:hypothetical protein
LVELSIWVLATVLALWIQLQMLYCLDQLLDRNDTDQLASCASFAREHGSLSPEWLLCIASNAALIVAVLSEMKGLLSFYEWINRLPQAKNEDLGVLNDLHCGFAVRKRVFCLGGTEFPLTIISHGGVSDWYRRVMRGACTFQMLLNFHVLRVGTAYICRSNGKDVVENLVENAVALIFVLEIDDLMFKLMVAPAAQRTFSNSIPSIPLIGRFRDKRDFADLQAYLGRYFYGERRSKGILTTRNLEAFLQLACVGVWVYTTAFAIPALQSWWQWAQSFICWKLDTWASVRSTICAHGLALVLADLVMAKDYTDPLPEAQGSAPKED